MSPALARRIIETTAGEHGVPAAWITGDRRWSEAARARQDVYSKLVAGGWSIRRTAGFMGRHHSTVLHGLRRVAE